MRWLWAGGWLVVSVGCSALTLPKATVPAGISCDHVFVAMSDVASALASAQAGDCVVMPAGTFTGNFTVPADVSLMAGEGAQVTLKGADPAQPVLTIHGGPRTTLKGFRVSVTDGAGIVIEPGPVNMMGVTVTGAAQALTVTCASADCAAETTVDDCEFDANAAGVLVRGAAVLLKGGVVTNSAGTRVSDGVGVLATRGAQLHVERTRIEGNRTAGLVIDGAGTRARLEDAVVKNNLGRGLWLQGLTGADSVVAQRLEVVGNSLLGIGAVDSSGLRFSDTHVADTKAVAVSVSVSVTELVGDGMAFLQGAGSVALERVTLENNARAQLLVDSVSGDLSSSALAATGGRFRAVVQRTTRTVDVPPTLVDTPASELFVTDTRVSVAP